jgi:hypothetical protein
MVIQGLDLELATMQHLATALSQLDPAARARTLQWLCQRFDTDITRLPHETAAPSASSPLRIVPAPAAEPDEAMENLDDLFDTRQAAPAPERGPQSVTGLLSEFVAEFQQIAREWDDACGAPAEVHHPPRILSVAS